MDEKKLLQKCDFCEKSFFNEEILSLHLKSIHTKIIEGRKEPFEKDMQCDFCDKRFDAKKYLEKHVRTIHKNTEK